MKNMGERKPRVLSGALMKREGSVLPMGSVVGEVRQYLHTTWSPNPNGPWDTVLLQEQIGKEEMEAPTVILLLARMISLDSSESSRSLTMMALSSCWSLVRRVSGFSRRPIDRYTPIGYFLLIDRLR